MKLQKVGGVASLANGILTVAYLISMNAVFPNPSVLSDPVKCVDAMAAMPMAFFSVAIVHILWAIFSLLTVLALRERMQAGAPILTEIALIAMSIASGLLLFVGIYLHATRSFLISVGDASVFKATFITGIALGKSSDHAMGWSLLLIGWAAFRTNTLKRILACLIVLTGLLLILDFLAAVLATVGIFLFTIMSFWLGITLLRTKNQAVLS